MKHYSFPQRIGLLVLVIGMILSLALLKNIFVTLGLAMLTLLFVYKNKEEVGTEKEVSGTTENKKPVIKVQLLYMPFLAILLVMMHLRIGGSQILPYLWVIFFIGITIFFVHIFCVIKKQRTTPTPALSTQASVERTATRALLILGVTMFIGAGIFAVGFFLRSL